MLLTADTTAHPQQALKAASKHFVLRQQQAAAHFTQLCVRPVEELLMFTVFMSQFVVAY